VHVYQHTKFQLSSSINFRDREGVPKFNVGAISSPSAARRTLKFVLLKSQTVCQIPASQLYTLWNYANVFAIALLLHVPQNVRRCTCENSAKLLGCKDNLKETTRASNTPEATRASINTGGTRASKLERPRSINIKVFQGLPWTQGLLDNHEPKGILREEGLTFPSAIMPNTKTQA